MIAENHAKTCRLVLLEGVGRFATDNVNANETHKIIYIFMEGQTTKQDFPSAWKSLLFNDFWCIYQQWKQPRARLSSCCLHLKIKMKVTAAWWAKWKGSSHKHTDFHRHQLSTQNFLLFKKRQVILHKNYGNNFKNMH